MREVISTRWELHWRNHHDLLFFDLNGFLFALLIVAETFTNRTFES